MNSTDNPDPIAGHFWLISVFPLKYNAEAKESSCKFRFIRYPLNVCKHHCQGILLLIETGGRHKTRFHGLKKTATELYSHMRLRQAKIIRLTFCTIIHVRKAGFPGPVP